MSLAKRRGMVDREHLSLSIARQCAPRLRGGRLWLGVARSSLYYRPREASGENLALMQAMDRQYLDTPFYGSRRIMGLRAIYRSPRTSRPAPEHRVYPYLLERSELPGPTRRGRPTSPTCPWPRNVAGNPDSLQAVIFSTSFVDGLLVF